METITQTLLWALGRLGPVTGLCYRHVNTAVNRSQREQSTFRLHKLVRLWWQLALASAVAVQGYDAYYPISQNRIGLLRDIVLLLPFRLTRRAIILHLHGGALDQVLRAETWWMRTVVRAVAGGPRAYGIVLTPSLRRCLEPLVRTERIGILPNAVLTPAHRGESADRRGTLRVLYLSTLIPSKGYRELVRAVSALARAGVDVQLDLAGEPASQQDDAWIETYAADPAIQFRGPLIGAAKWNALDRAHVLALPSIEPEGQPLAILEGMACGCAILTTAQGGISETVDQSEGAVLERVDHSSLEAEIRRVLTDWSEDREALARAGNAARARFERTHSPEPFIQRWLMVAALAGQASSRCSPVSP
jgi:glycosyltransferase involved in cell wall biosynthesis